MILVTLAALFVHSLMLVRANNLISLRVEHKRFKLGLELDLAPLLFGEKPFHGELLTSHVLHPANNLELFFDHAVGCVREFVSVRVATRATSEDALDAQPNAAEKSNWDALEHHFFGLSRVVFTAARPSASGRVPEFIAIADEISVIAHVVQHDFVLEDENNDSEDASKRPCQSTQVSQKVEQAVNFAANDLQVSAQLISDRQLGVVEEVVETDGPGLHDEHVVDLGCRCE